MIMCSKTCSSIDRELVVGETCLGLLIKVNGIRPGGYSTGQQTACSNVTLRDARHAADEKLSKTL